MTGAAFNRGASRQDWETPPELIAAVEARFGRLQCDLACSSDNMKALSGFVFDRGQDSLADSSEWPLHQLCWLNPPYSAIKPWASKCAESGSKVLLLVPASVGSNWFRDYVYDTAHVLFLNGRVQFVGAEQNYPKDLMLCCYNLFPEPYGVEVWDWRREVAGT